MLQAMHGLLLSFDRVFKVLDVLSSPFSESGLRLPVALLAFLRGSIDLHRVSLASRMMEVRDLISPTGLRPPLRF